jgi:hypothetical protein
MELSGMPGRLVVALPTLSGSHGMAALRVDTGRATRGLCQLQEQPRGHISLLLLREVFCYDLLVRGAGVSFQNRDCVMNVIFFVFF